jgi:hypothetical protein
MINLLPYDVKKQIRTARRNVTLLRCLIILGFFALILVAACYVTFFILNGNNTTSVKPIINKSTSPTQIQADTLRSDLVMAKNILDQQVSYSDIITGIAAALPAGSVLDSLTLNDSAIGTTTNLKVFARSADIETKLKENFNKSTQFTNYKLQTTTTNLNNSSEYPFTIDFSVTINKGTAK